LDEKIDVIIKTVVKTTY